MEAVKDSHEQGVAGNKTMVQGWVDRDVYFVFRDFCRSHKLSIGQGIGWAIRSLLTSAGIKVRRDRVERVQNAGE